MCYIKSMEDKVLNTNHKQQTKTTMNIKAIALSATLALGSLFGAVAPAEAGTCWFINNGQTNSGEFCQVGRRVNANGHRVWDITTADKVTLTLVIWDDNYAEVLHDMIPYGERWVKWYIDRDGDYRFILPHGEFSFRA